MASMFEKMHEAEGLDHSGLKHRVATFIESHTMEAIIFLLIIADIVLVFIEMGVDHHFFCVSGSRVDASPGELEAFAAAAPGTAVVASLLQAAPVLAGGPLAGSLMQGLAMAAALVAPSSVRVSLREAALRAPPAPDLGAVMLDQQHAEHRMSNALRRRVPHTQGAALWPAGTGEVELAGPTHLTELHPRPVPDAHAADAHGEAGGAADDPHGAHAHGEPAHGAHEAHDAAGHAAHDGAHDGHHAHAHGPERALVCEDRNGHNAHHLTHTCHTWSLVILFCFALELSLKFWVHPAEFMGNPFHMLDLFIVVASILVDTVVTWLIESYRQDGVNPREVEYLALLLMLCRLWRVVRIVHGLLEVCVSEDSKEELEHLMSKREQHHKHVSE